MHPIRMVMIFADHATSGEPEERCARRVRHCWAPLIGLLESLPRLRIGLFLSGTTGQWMEAHEPTLLGRIGRCVDRGQVELLVGPHFGSAPQLIPERDVLAQLRIHAQWLQSRVGKTDGSAWLTTGAWDPQLPRTFVRAELRCTMLHGDLLPLAPSGLHDPWYVVERGGPAIGVMPIDPLLSAMIPWGTPKSFGLELRRRREQGQSAVTVAISVDDLGMSELAEQRCWDREHGQMPLFLQLLARHSTWIRSMTPQQLLRQSSSGGRVVPFPGTPISLGTSLLEPNQGLDLVRLGEAVHRRPDSVTRAAAAFLRGPPLEFALQRWDEANRIHKRMLRASAGLHALRKKLRRSGGSGESLKAIEVATLRLYRGQGVGVLHDGPGGFLRVGEARHRVWMSLLDAEQCTWESVKVSTARLELVDYDCDGRKEVLVTSPSMQMVVRPGLCGGLSEWLIWGVGNLCNTLRRTREVWMETLESQRGIPTLVEPTGVSEPDDLSRLSVVGSSREIVWPSRPEASILEAGLGELLSEDLFPKIAFTEHFWGAQVDADNLARGQYPELSDFRGAPYRLDSAEQDDDGQIRIGLSREGRILEGDTEALLHVMKAWTIAGHEPSFTVSYDVVNRSKEPAQAHFAVCIPLNLDSVISEHRWIQISDKPQSWNERQHSETVDDAILGFEDLGLRLRVHIAPTAQVVVIPVRVPVNSAEGMRSEFQGVELWLSWPMQLWGTEKRRVELSLSLEMDD